MSVNIHGKEYITVAERLEMAKKDILEIQTEVLFQEPVVIKAIVTLKDGRKATGISAANPQKTIEKASPYEVAETSALGRALGFLGYGITNGIATADEMAKVDPTDEWPEKKVSEHFCRTHNKELKYRGGIIWDHQMLNEEDNLWYRCNGDGQWKVKSLQR